MKSLEELKIKIQELKKENLNEAQTKEWLIRPFFEFLGWNFSNPSEVVPEDDDIAGKKTDYSFYINGQKKLLVEAKPLQNRLDDEKMISEKLNYTANTGVSLLLITNGDTYKIFFSELKGIGKEKLLLEFTISEYIDDQILSLLRKEAFQNDLLLKYAKNISVLNNVKKALESLFTSPDKQFIKLINERIKHSLGHKFGNDDIELALNNFSVQITSDIGSYDDSLEEEVEVNDIPKNFTIEYHFKDGRWEESLNLYNNLIKRLRKEGLKFEQQPRKVYISLSDGKKSFCQIKGYKSGIKIYLGLDFIDLTEEEKLKVRDVSMIGHHGIGNIEYFIEKESEIERAISLINKAYKKIIS